ncbi:unnamed protein product [Orchesella dallaii]|uniref:Uncharacterized protein n=1 Tax=Orchesella dallaii TaxID=48710 RepID=A0ABP1PQ91_9HEXA
MASKVFRSQACNDMLTIIPDFRFEETDTDELKLKPVTPSAWTQKFIDILSKSVILVDCLNILCNLHKYDQRNYQALIVDLFETLRPEVEVREI